MRAKRSWPLAIVLAAAFAYAVVRLFGIQFATGEVYPEYSSLRSDPMGSKLLYASLAGVHGIDVERNFLPLQFLAAGSAAVLLLGTAATTAEPTLRGLERTAERGNRVVIALHFADPMDPSEGKGLGEVWHVKVEYDGARGRAHRFYFAAPPRGWTTLDSAGPKVLAIEKPAGKGSIALFAESDDFSNQSTVAMDRLPQVSAALGAYSHIVFDEQHLGIEEGGSIMGLARRFRLTGIGLGLALVAALFFWKNAAAFPPPEPRAPGGERLAGLTSHAGLMVLLRRHVGERDLAAACWREWLAGNRASTGSDRIARAEAAASAAVGPLDALRRMDAALHGKGEL